MNFDEAIYIVGIQEKGLTKNPKDRGNYTPDGKLVGTKFGISAKSYPQLDIPNLTWTEAKAIYLKDFWLRYNLDKIPASLRLFTFDSMINHGPVTGAKLLQRAVGVTADGVIGPVTLSRAAQISPEFFAEVRSDYYVDIVKSDPTQIEFLKGWMRRNIKILSESL